MLDVGFEDRPRQLLQVWPHITQEALATAIAEKYEVEGEMELVTGGTEDGQWRVSETARYTLFRAATMRRVRAAGQEEKKAVMYGPLIDRSFSRTTLSVSFEERRWRTLEVRTDIDEETLVTAIAELYGVEGEMQLDIQGGEALGGWFQVSSAAKYTLYRVATILRKWPQYLLRPHVVRPRIKEPVPIVIRYGMREAQVTAPPNATRGEMVEHLVQHFRAGDGEWMVEVEDAARNKQDHFEVAAEWRYSLEQVRRQTVQVKMRHNGQERMVEVPEKTSEAGMKQLLVSGFGADIGKNWRVLTLSPMHREGPYELRKNWVYELREYVPPARPESFIVMANTWFNGQRDDIEIETAWNERQVHEACREVWRSEMSAARNCGTPTTKLITLDDQGQRVQFEARAGWTYEIRIQPQTPKWVFDEKMTKGAAPSKPNEEIMIGLQLEDGPRIERKVKRSTGESGLKLLAWELFDWPPGPLYVHVVSSRGETEYAFKIEPQWTYILRARPLKVIRPERDRTSDGYVRQGPKPGQKEPTRAKGQMTLGLGARRHITGWCGTKTLSLTVNDAVKKSDLIDRIVEKLGEPKGSYTMEIKD
jgi:hypothetical protein